MTRPPSPASGEAPEDLVAQLEPVSELGRLVAGVVRAAGSAGQGETVKDVAALLAALRACDAPLADGGLAAARSILVVEDFPTLPLVDTDGGSFGPVSPDLPNAAEKLALLAWISFRDSLLAPLLSECLQEFVASAAAETPAALVVAARVQVLLGDLSLNGLRWRDAAAPLLLAVCVDAAEPVAACAGASLPDAWTRGAAWIAPWADARFASGTLGLDPPQGDGQLFAHPLVLPRLEARLGALNVSADMRLAALTALTDRVATSPTTDDGPVAPAASAGPLLAAGALLARQALGDGAVLAGDGSVAPGRTPEVASLLERVMRAVLFGCEVPNTIANPAPWPDQSRMADLWAACPLWTTGLLAEPMRGLARTLATASLRALSRGFASYTASLPDAAQGRAVDAQAAGVEIPGQPLAADAEDWIPRSFDAVRRLGDGAAALRAAVARRISGPIGEGLIAALLPSRDAPEDELPAQQATLTVLGGALSTASGKALEAVLGDRVWLGWFEAAADRDAAWAALEPWDWLRGRLLSPADARDMALAEGLYNALPIWLTTDADPSVEAAASAAVRAAVAAVTLLGLPGGADSGKLGALLARLNVLLDPATALSAPVRGLAAAARVELTVTLAAAGGPLPQSFARVEDFAQFAGWVSAAAAAPEAWTQRAAMNGALLLARLAETTADPLIARVVARLSPPLVEQITAEAVARLLAGHGAGAGLPLAYAATTLARFAAERMRALGDEPVAPSWMEAAPLTVQGGDPQAMLRAMKAAVCADVSPLEGFAWQGGRAGRALLVALAQIELRAFGVGRAVTARPLVAGDSSLSSLQAVLDSVRRSFIAERLLSQGLPASAVDPAPWWSLRYWTTGGALGEAAGAAARAPDRTFALVNWAASSLGNLDGAQLQTAASLAAQTPGVRAGRPLDVDGFPDAAPPTQAVLDLRRQLGDAGGQLKAAEDAFDAALGQEAAASERAETIDLLRRPLLLSTADAADQVAGADAEARRAAADLDAATHELAAAQFSEASTELVYAAAKTELTMQASRAAVADDQSKIDALQAQIGAIDAQIAQGGVDVAKLYVLKATLLEQAAQARLRQAVAGRAALLDQLQLLKVLLVNDTPVDMPGEPPVKGLIARMGVQIGSSFRQKLDADLAEATHDLAVQEAAEERRRRLDAEKGFISGIISIVGGIVGFVCGGPAGATIGAALGHALGDLAGGLATSQPLGQLVTTLAGDTLSAAKAAGVNVDSLVATLGDATAQEAEQIYATLQSNLRSVLDTMPQAIDPAALRRAFRDLNAIAGDAGDRIQSAIAGVEEAGGAPPDLAAAFRAAGLPVPIAFDRAQDLMDTVAQQLVPLINGGAPPALADALRSLAGVSGDTPPDAVAERLSQLVATRAAAAGAAYRAEAMRRWLTVKQQARQTWDQVRQEGELMIGRLFPDPQMQSEALANARLALTDPQTIKAELDGLMAPWQAALDRHIAAVRQAGEDAAGDKQPTSALDAARARVAYIEASRKAVFDPGGLLDFLRDSPERIALIQQLEERSDQDRQASGDLTVAALSDDGAATDVDVARKMVDQAQQQFEKAKQLQAIYALRSDQDLWRKRLNDLAGVQADTLAKARQDDAQAAEARSKGASSRVQAAQAALDARRAYALGARYRASEAARARAALAAPPLRLADELAQGAMARARHDHQRALESALTSVRQLLRLTRMIPGGGGDTAKAAWPATGQTLRWSEYVAQLGQGFDQTLGASPALPKSFDVDLDATQVAALVDPQRGLRIVARPGAIPPDANDGVRRALSPDAAASGQLLLILISGRQATGAPLQSGDWDLSAEYLGDRWLSASDLRLIGLRSVAGSRLDVLAPDKDPDAYVQGISGLTQAGGMLNPLRLGGTAMSGTTILHAARINGDPIAAPLRLYVTYSVMTRGV